MEYRQNRFLNIVAGLFLVGFSFFVLKELQSIFLPFFMAVIISFLFEPFYEYMKRKRIPSAVAILVIVIIIILISNIANLFIFTSISSFNTELPKYIQKGQSLFSGIESFIASLGFSPDFKNSFNLTRLISSENVADIISRLLSGIAGLFTNFILILIYVIFLLTEFGSIRRRVMRAFSAEKARKINEALSDILRDVRKYVVGKTLINLSHAVTITIVFWIFGLDFAIIWGFLTFILAYIPNIGAIIATVLPFATALLEYDNVFTPVLLLIIMTFTGFVFGNVVEPKVLGGKLNLSPILLIFSLIFWGYLWGIVGMILSVPVMSMIKIVLSKFESTKPIAILMSNEVDEKKVEQLEMNFTEKQ
jgi:AI-2 transport protein TqsA